MIFISHSSSDKLLVDRLVGDLIGWGFEVWFSRLEIKAGESISEKIQAALRQSDCLVVILSRASCKASWVKRELGSFLSRQISDRRGKIIPVVIERCRLPFLLRDILQIRLYEEGYDQGLIALAFQLLEFSRGTSAMPAMDVFRRRTLPVKNAKQFFSRYNQIIRDLAYRAPEYLVLNDRRRIHVSRSRDVTVKVSLDILLCKPTWGLDDWQDTIYDSSQKHDLRSIGYRTNSKVLKSIYDKKCSSVVVRWQPKRLLSNGRIYRHEYTWGVKDGFPDATDYWVHRRYPYLTLRTEIQFSSAAAIDQMIPCRPPFTFECIEPWEFIAYAQRSLDTFNHVESRSQHLRLTLTPKELAEGVLIALLFPGWKECHDAERTAGSQERNRLFEQQWCVEREFRKAIGWGALGDGPR